MSAMITLDLSHPTRGEWIEIFEGVDVVGADKSHPTRGEWIEIRYHVHIARLPLVSPHTG